MAEKIIITGGPGCGKSEVGKMLSLMDYGYLAETPELVIKQERVKEILDPAYKGILPWNDITKFQEHLLEVQQTREAKYFHDNPEGIAFLDRSLVDPIAYCAIAGIPVPEGQYEAIERAGYNKTMFMPDQHNGYVNSVIRRESQQEAIKLQDKMREVYSGLGFKIIAVPDFAKIPEGASESQRNDAILEGIVKRAMFIRERLEIPEAQVSYEGPRPRSMYQIPGGR